MDRFLSSLTDSGGTQVWIAGYAPPPSPPVGAGFAPGQLGGEQLILAPDLDYPYPAGCFSTACERPGGFRPRLAPRVRSQAMDISALTAPPSSAQGDGIQKSFREADFLAVMLTEITNQDPFQPTETAKMVEQMQQLQSLANSNFEKYRADIQWADNLVGKEITVTQVNMSTAEVQVLAERGVNADVGFGNVTGTVDTYRTVGETVWVSIGGKDYPIDNVQGITPEARANPARLAELSAGLLGRQVTYLPTDGKDLKTGRVDGLAMTAAGDVVLSVGDKSILLEQVRQIR